jgi:aspartyl-tRNA synthetase
MRDYLRCFQYGCPPHGGFGLGLGRVLMVLLGLESLRETTFLFRGPNRLTP